MRSGGREGGAHIPDKGAKGEECDHGENECKKSAGDAGVWLECKARKKGTKESRAYYASRPLAQPGRTNLSTGR